MSCPRRTDDGVAQLSGLSLQKGELLDVLSVPPLRCLSRPTLLHTLTLKEGDFLCKALGIGTSRGERCRILHIGTPALVLPPLLEWPGPQHP
jgi:hypothetical protein